MPLVTVQLISYTKNTKRSVQNMSKLTDPWPLVTSPMMPSMRGQPSLSCSALFWSIWRTHSSCRWRTSTWLMAQSCCRGDSSRTCSVYRHQSTPTYTQRCVITSDKLITTIQLACSSTLSCQEQPVWLIGSFWHTLKTHPFETLELSAKQSAQSVD